MLAYPVQKYPWVQIAHDDRLVPTPTLNLPARQGVHAVLLLLDHVPTGQLTHIPPTLIVPAAQLEHTDAPADEDMPVGQAVHADALVAPVIGCSVPAGHWLQLAFPACDQVPFGHTEHRKPFLELASISEKKPAAQVHPVALAPGADVLSRGHWLQAASPEIE